MVTFNTQNNIFIVEFFGNLGPTCMAQIFWCLFGFFVHFGHFGVGGIRNKTTMYLQNKKVMKLLTEQFICKITQPREEES